MHRAFFNERGQAIYADLPIGNVQEINTLDQLMSELSESEIIRLRRLVSRLKKSKRLENESILQLDAAEVISAMRGNKSDDRLILSLGGVLVGGESP